MRVGAAAEVVRIHLLLSETGSIGLVKVVSESNLNGIEGVSKQSC